jgi:uncharacterized small protein (DUF1192 family)
MEKEQEILQRLLLEKRNLGADLLSAIEKKDGDEIVRLKEREKTIDSELFSAQILALRAEIEEVEAQMWKDGENIVKAQALTKETDALVISQVGILREEIQTLNNDALSKLVGVRVAEQKRDATGARLRELREKLENLLQ